MARLCSQDIGDRLSERRLSRSLTREMSICLGGRSLSKLSSACLDLRFCLPEDDFDERGTLSKSLSGKKIYIYELTIRPTN